MEMWMTEIHKRFLLSLHFMGLALTKNTQEGDLLYYILYILLYYILCILM